MFLGRHRDLGRRTVVHAPAQLREDLRRRAPRGEDEEHVAEASLVAAGLLPHGGPRPRPRPPNSPPLPPPRVWGGAPPLSKPPVGPVDPPPTRPVHAGAAGHPRF